MKTTHKLGLLGLVALIAMLAGAQTRPVTGGPSGNSGASSLADTQWKGVYGSGLSSNIPATLQIHSQNGSLMGTLTYDGWEETVAVTTTGPRAFRIKGVSYRDTRGGRTFYLDNFSGQLTPDGSRMNATGGDTNSVVANAWLKLQKVDSTPGGASQPPSASLGKSLIGSNWNGSIAVIHGTKPAQLRILQQNGALNAILVYDQFQEVLGLTLTAPSGFQMQGTSYRDLLNQGRRFSLDKAQGQISSNGRTMQGRINGIGFQFRRLN